MYQSTFSNPHFNAVRYYTKQLNNIQSKPKKIVAVRAMDLMVAFYSVVREFGLDGEGK